MPYYLDLQELIRNQKPDLINISLPNEHHYDMTMKVIKSSCHLFVEKPLVFKMQEAKKLLAEAKKRKLFFGINFNWRYSTPVSKAIKTINNAVRIVGLSYEILIIDDCSKDNSVGVVEKYQTENPSLPILLFKNQKHRGLSCNYTDGAFLGKGEYYLFYGASNVTPEEDLIKMLEKIGTADMVIPYIQFDERDLSRWLLSRLFTIIVNGLSGFSLKYYNFRQNSPRSVEKKLGI